MSEAAAGHSHLLRGQYAVDGGNAPKVEIPPPADQMHVYHFRHISCCFIATSPALSEAYAVTRRPWRCFMSQSYSNIPNSYYMEVYCVYFSEFAATLSPRHAAHAADTLALMGAIDPSAGRHRIVAADDAKTPLDRADALQKCDPHPPVHKKSDIKPPKCQNHRSSTIQMQTVCQNPFTPAKRFVFPPPTTSPRPTP